MIPVYTTLICLRGRKREIGRKYRMFLTWLKMQKILQILRQINEDNFCQEEKYDL